MNLINIVRRLPVPEPWSEGDKIPWNEPGFSSRMLEYHLSQEHDLASRRLEIIDKHVNWIHSYILGKKPSRVLDLGCGPGFYSSRLTSLGHSCVGIDFSPASIEYAKKEATDANQDIMYYCEDIRTFDYGSGHDLAVMVYGEFNVFNEDDIKCILRKAYDSLNDGGVFIAEPNRFETIKGVGETPASWYSAESGLFSAEPHLCLMENFWDDSLRTSISRYMIVDAESGEVTLHASSMIAYTKKDYEKLLKDVGFCKIEFHESLTGDTIDLNTNLEVIIARKKG